MENYNPSKQNPKQAGVTGCKSHKADFKLKLVQSDKGHYEYINKRNTSRRDNIYK
jgi:hypothetical protein